MTSSTDIARRTPAQDLVAQIRDPRVKEQLAMALPPTVTVDKFVRIMTAAIMTNPDIAKLDHNSILTALVRSAADGLIPDGREAALTPRGGKAVYVPMIGGFRKIAGEHGWSLRTKVVYANDEFDHAVIDGEETINHREVRPGSERGELVAAYAIAKHRDGRKMMVVLHPEDIAKRRASASTQQVWEAHPQAMWEKSAGRDLFAQLPLADSDLVARVLSSDLDPVEASEALYGSREIAASSEPVAAARDPEQGGGSQQVGARETTSPVAPTPGDQDDEPSLTETETVTDDEQSAIEAAAQQAAMFMPPTGKHKDKTLGEIAHISDSDGWFVWVMRKDDLQPVYSQAVWAFCRVYKPALFQQVLAEKEAQAAA